MSQDTARLSNDLRAMFTTIHPEADEMKLNVRIEEVLSNYENRRKQIVEIEKDIAEKSKLFIDAKRLEGLSNNTLIDYKMELKLFERYFNKAAVQITTVDIREFLGQDKGWNVSTIEKKLSLLRTFFGWLVKEEILLRDPTAKIKSPKIPKRIPKGMSVEELEIVRDSCKTLRQRALMEVFYSTATRLSELANMKIKDINWQTMSARVIGKGNKEGIVYFSSKAIYHLRKYLGSRDDNCEYLFVTQRKPHRKMSNRAIQDEVNRISNYSNLDKKITCHRFRHSFAGLSMEAGIELADLQYLMRHSNPSTTLVYANVSEERGRQAFKRFHSQ